MVSSTPAGSGLPIGLMPGALPSDHASRQTLNTTAMRFFFGQDQDGFFIGATLLPCRPAHIPAKGTPVRRKGYAPIDKTGGATYRNSLGASWRARPQSPHGRRHIKAVMPMPTMAAAITAKVIHPVTHSSPRTTNLPMTCGLAVITIIMAITGTATTPLMTALQ